MDKADKEFIIDEIESGTCPCCEAGIESEVTQTVGNHASEKNIFCEWTERKIADWAHGYYNLHLDNHEL